MTVGEYQACDRTGDFKAEIIEYGLREIEGRQSVCVPIRALLTEMWDGEKWIDWREYQMAAEGDLWIGKSDGTANERQIESLIKYAGWDGSLPALVDGSWKPTPCQVQVQLDEYKDQKRYKISWLNPIDRTPGGGALSNVDDSKVKALEARFGSTLRALSGNVRRNQAPAASKPSAPPKPPANAQPVGAANGEIPF